MVAWKPCVAWCLCPYDKAILVNVQTPMLVILMAHGNTWG